MGGWLGVWMNGWIDRGWTDGGTDRQTDRGEGEREEIERRDRVPNTADSVHCAVLSNQSLARTRT